jgi:hypothetical protein
VSAATLPSMYRVGVMSKKRAPQKVKPNPMKTKMSEAKKYANPKKMMPITEKVMPNL